MKAAPSSISAEATIMDADKTILRPGTNGWTCFPGVPLIPGDKHPMCNDAVWMTWLNALFNGQNPPARTTVGYSYMLRGDALVNNDDPSGGPSGIFDQEGPHIMILFPTNLTIQNTIEQHHSQVPVLYHQSQLGPFVFYKVLY